MGLHFYSNPTDRKKGAGKKGAGKKGAGKKGAGKKGAGKKGAGYFLIISPAEFFNHLLLSNQTKNKMLTKWRNWGQPLTG